jgi:hypothetical protein
MEKTYGVEQVPFHGLVKPCALDGRCLEYLILSVFERWQSERRGHLGRAHRSLDVLLVGKHAQHGVLQLVFLFRQLCASARLTKMAAKEGHIF